MGQLPRLDIKSLPGPETVVRRALDNGITFLARENFSSPSVIISGYLPVGALMEEADMAGLASMTAASMMRGTKNASSPKYMNPSSQSVPASTLRLENTAHRSPARH